MFHVRLPLTRRIKCSTALLESPMPPDKAGTVIAARLVRCDEGMHSYFNGIQGCDELHGVGIDDGGSVGVGGAISTQSGSGFGWSQQTHAARCALSNAPCPNHRTAPKKKVASLLHAQRESVLVAPSLCVYRSCCEKSRSGASVQVPKYLQSKRILHHSTKASGAQ